MNERRKNSKNWNLDPAWTLFLDRDGVINRRIENGYVTKLSEFEFLPGALESISRLSGIFKRMFIVTNQRGISRGLYTVKDLSVIHDYLLESVRQVQGKIDGIYFCPHDDADKCGCRKPDIGMGLKAQHDFPEVDFERSIMVGDSNSDIGFGQNLKMKTVLITSTKSKEKGGADLIFSSLQDFANSIKKP